MMPVNTVKLTGYSEYWFGLRDGRGSRDVSNAHDLCLLVIGQAQRVFVCALKAAGLMTRAGRWPRCSCPLVGLKLM